MEGLAWLWRHRLLRTLALLLGVINGATAAAEAVLVLYVLEVLHQPRAVYPLLLVAVTAGAFIGFGSAVWNVVTISLRQAVVPARLLGRVTSSYRLMGMGVMPVGAAMGGLASRAYGLRAPYLIGGAVMLVATLLALPTLVRADRAGEAEQVNA